MTLFKYPRRATVSSFLSLKVTISKRIVVITFRGKSGLLRLNTATTPTIAAAIIKLIKIFTLFGNSGFKKTIMSGRVIKTVIVVEAIKVVETTVEIDLINSPIIPDAIRIGRNAQTAVRVVDQIGMKKSRRTSKPVWLGVN